GAGPAASRARRLMAAPLGEHAQLHGRQRFELAHHPVPTRPTPHTPTPPSQGVRLQPQGTFHLQDLNGRVPRVRHPHVHTGRSGCVRGRALATPVGLVVLPATLYTS